MKFQFYYEKLINSEEYEKFKKDHPDAFACSGFFVLDVLNKGKENKASLDFWLPKEEKMYSFKIDGKTEFVNVDNFDPRTPEKLSMNYDFDLKDFQKLIEEKMEQEKVKGSMQKILFSLQRLEGKDYLVTTTFLNNFGLLKINIDISKKEITSFEKKSFLDMLKIVKKKKD
jgi:hypothetical protein